MHHQYIRHIDVFVCISSERMVYLLHPVFFSCLNLYLHLGVGSLCLCYKLRQPELCCDEPDESHLESCDLNNHKIVMLRF